MKNNNPINKLKEIQSCNKLFHKYEEDFQILRSSVDFKSIQNMLKISSEREIRNVHFSCFMNGEPVASEGKKEAVKIVHKNTLDSLVKNLPCSLRITNIQLLNEDLKKLCFRMFKNFNTPVTINMYITPGSKKNCFLYHPDPQDSFIYQYYGNKKWFIPKDKDDNFIFSSNFGLQQEKMEEYSPYEFDVSEGDLIYLPHCLLHKAEGKEDDLSIHFTFAFLNYFKKTFGIFISNKYELELSSEDDLEIVTTENMLKWMEHLKISEKEKDNIIKEFYKKVEADNFRILKYGRPYDSEASIGDIF